MLSTRALVRSSAVLSFMLHAAIVAAVLGLFARPKLFASRPEQTVTVDLVPPIELSGATKVPAQGPGPEASKEAGGGRAKTAQKSPPQEAPQPQAQTTQQESPQPQAQAAQQEAAPPPETRGVATFTPMPSMKPPSAFSVSEIPATLDLVTPAAGSGLAPRAEMPADLTADDIGAFKARLRTCWRPPADLAGVPNLKVTLRVFLTRNGTLARAPVLLAASASMSGPALVQTATTALQACQPFGLPADRYKEWKVLDLTLSPADMAGG
jgi:outer membrane biosynthesis protein TonB